jgi:RimJ/RimL family protein N-acetyltransferase
MNILAGTKVDLIDPFPLSEARRAYRWMRCYKNIIESDLSPHTEEEFEDFMASILPRVRSWGVIDRDNVLGIHHEAPLIGFVMFEPNTMWNGYIHIASTRRAWGSGLMDDAVTTAIGHLFTADPQLLRVSAYILPGNSLVQGMAKRLGFAYEGFLRDMVTQGGKPKGVLHFGLTRYRWEERQGAEETSGVFGVPEVPEAPVAPVVAEGGDGA